jgi:hypothetical protein
MFRKKFRSFSLYFQTEALVSWILVFLQKSTTYFNLLTVFNLIQAKVYRQAKACRTFF